LTLSEEVIATIVWFIAESSLPSFCLHMWHLCGHPYFTSAIRLLLVLFVSGLGYARLWIIEPEAGFVNE